MGVIVNQYHPRIGAGFLPNLKARVPFESGGYLVRTNAAGYRSDREFVKERTPGKFRVLLFGDSQTAGDGTSNGSRYSDFLEQFVPGLEVYNYGLPGTGTDQQYLTYLECAEVHRDLVVIGLNVENIARVANRFFAFTDPHGEEAIYAKPYFLMGETGLTLHHIPVPKTRFARSTLSAEEAGSVHRGVPFAALRSVVKKLGMRDILQKITQFQPVPEYDSPSGGQWLLLRKILETWIGGSQTPVLVFLMPTWPFIEESSDPTHYQTRFHELVQATQCHLHDPLPDLWKYAPEERRAFRHQVDTHFTSQGHRALAASLAPVIESMMSGRRS